MTSRGEGGFATRDSLSTSWLKVNASLARERFEHKRSRLECATVKGRGVFGLLGEDQRGSGRCRSSFARTGAAEAAVPRGASQAFRQCGQNFSPSTAAFRGEPDFARLQASRGYCKYMKKLDLGVLLDLREQAPYGRVRALLTVAECLG